MAAFALREIFTAAICNSQAARTAEMHDTQVVCALLQKMNISEFSSTFEAQHDVNNIAKYIFYTCEPFVCPCSLHIQMQQAGEKCESHLSTRLLACLQVSSILDDHQYCIVPSLIWTSQCRSSSIQRCLVNGYCYKDLPTLSNSLLVLQTEKVCQILH